MKESLDAIETRMREYIEPDIEALRLMVRRLRFANDIRARNAPGRTTSDTAFFDGMRRKFMQKWELDPDFFLKCEPYQLLFLANLLDLPAIRGHSTLFGGEEDAESI